MAFILSDSCSGDQFVPEPIHYVMADYNQSNVPNGTPQAGGKQCCAMSLVALSAAEIIVPAQWQGRIMNEILRVRDFVYEQVVLGKKYQEVGDAPLAVELSQALDLRHYQYLVATDLSVLGNQFILQDRVVTIVPEETLCGSICGTLWPGAPDLFRILDKTLSRNGSKVLVTLGGYTYASWKLQDTFWLFDSHSRNSKGKCVPEGKAFCGSYASLYDICLVIFQNFRDEYGRVKEGPVDVTPISIILDESRQPIINSLPEG